MNHEMPNNDQSVESVIQDEPSSGHCDTDAEASIINIANIDDSPEANILHTLESLRQQLGQFQILEDR